MSVRVRFPSEAHQIPLGDYSKRDFCINTLLQGAEHLFDAFLLLLHVGMDIEVQGGADVGVSEKDTHCLVVTISLYAACCKAMTEPMKFQRRDIQLPDKLIVVVPVGSGLNWLTGTCKYIAVSS